MSFCSHCGTPVTGNFCTHCGTPVSSGAEAMTTSAMDQTSRSLARSQSRVDDVLNASTPLDRLLSDEKAEKSNEAEPSATSRYNRSSRQGGQIMSSANHDQRSAGNQIPRNYTPMNEPKPCNYTPMNMTPANQSMATFDPSQHVAMVNPCNKMTSLLLCIFLGWLGAHRFYEGKTFSAVIYLLTFGLFGFGVIIDLFILAFKPSVYDSNA